MEAQDYVRDIDISSQILIANRYKLESVIGQSEYGTVFRGYDTVEQKQVAIKVFERLLMRDKRGFTHAQYKIALQQALVHDNILKIYDFNRDTNEIVYSTMELIDGDNLLKLITEEDNLDFKKMLDILYQVSSALAFSHNYATVHNNIEPENILISNTNKVCISDFGMVLFKDERTLHYLRRIGDHYWYVAPELAYEIEPNQRTDIYSFGILTYHLAQGKLPFPIRDQEDLKRCLLLPKLPPLGGKAAKLPAWFHKLVATCVDRRPGYRIQAFYEIVRLLEKNIEELGRNAPSPTKKYYFSFLGKIKGSRN